MKLGSIKEKLIQASRLSKVAGYGTLEQFVKYLVVGILAFLTEYLIFAILYKYITHNDVISNIAAMTTGFFASFILNRTWSFKSRGNAIKQLVLLLALFTANLGISSAFIHYGSELLALSPLVLKFFIMGVIVLWNFLLYKKVIYR
jgi:putative flippase GtrA